MLLAEGHVVYYGPSAAVVPWFGALGFACPYGVNVADFLLDLAQGEVEGGDAGRLWVVTAAGAAGAPQEGGVIEQEGGKQQSPALLSGPAAVVALYASYEHFAAGGHKREGFSGGDDQLAALRLALEPPAPKAAAVGGAGGGSFLSRSFQRAGSFLRLDSAAAAAEKQSAKAAAAADAAAGDEEDPECGRPISRAWSRSASMSVAAAPAGGVVGRVVRELGVADRGGAGFFTQWSVLLRRAIKVGGGGCGGGRAAPGRAGQTLFTAAPCCTTKAPSRSTLLPTPAAAPFRSSSLQVKRFESLSSQRFWQSAAVAVITGLFWWQRGRGNSLLAASDVVGLLFFELLFPAFTAMFTALFVFPNDFR
jgi:hypothetical protein